MSISVGDQFPSVTVKRLGDGGMEDVDTGALTKGRKVVLFGVPGAYTPTCHKEHLPGYINRADDLKSKGVDEIVCLSVNDPFVMKAWGEETGASGKVTMLPDGNGAITEALGLGVDMSGAGLGTRCKRFSMVVDDGKVTTLNVEENPGKLDVSSAEKCGV